MKKIFAIAIAVVLIAVSALPVFAAPVISPSATTANYIINIPDDIEGGSATVDVITDVDEDGNEVIVIRGVPEDGYDFAGWEIDGEFIPHGDLTDIELELIISGDVKVVPKFVKKGESVPTSPTGTPGSGEKVVDGGSKSPQTGSGDFAVYIVLFASVAALLATVAVVKRRSTNR